MKGQHKIVSLTAYSSSIAKLIDPVVDFILVGDSTAMVGYGRASTLSMQLEEIIGHTRAVVDSTRLSCVIADMPFGSYQESNEQAFRNCAQVLARTGCDAVKLEASKALAGTVEFLVARGIPVMAHVGLMLQFVKQYADVGAVIRDACERFADDVRHGRFPETRHCYGL